MLLDRERGDLGGMTLDMYSCTVRGRCTRAVSRGSLEGKAASTDEAIDDLVAGVDGVCDRQVVRLRQFCEAIL